MDRYRWNILELFEMRLKNVGETTTEEEHRVFHSGKEDKHEHGVGFLVHEDIVNTLMGCRPISSRLITIRLRAAPLKITIVHVYDPTSDFNDNEIEEFYDQLQNVIDQTPKKYILVVQGDWNAKVGWDACGNWQGICGPFCNEDAYERGLRLPAFASFTDLLLENTFAHHKTFRRWSLHSPNGQHHNSTSIRPNIRLR